MAMAECSDCEGTGKCPNCEGTGEVSATEGEKESKAGNKRSPAAVKKFMEQMAEAEE